MTDIDKVRLPAGMRDFAPAAAAARRRIAETLIGVFERWGYARVITPAFEYEEVLGLGLGAAGRAAAVRFVEPSSGQVVALRPDITPQIARLIATRYRDEVGPVRLCYEGTVVRFDGRARSQREIIQAGVELAGVEGPLGDAEAIVLAAAALESIGLPEPTIDLAHPGLARAVLGALELPDDVLPRVRERIGKRDGAGLRALLSAAKGPKAVVEFAARLPDLSGSPALLAEASRKAPTSAIRDAIEGLRGLIAELEREDLHGRLHVDLGEVRGFDYYTGVRFQGFVEGAAGAVLQGGRYDSLIGRYGRSRPAVGFAVDVEAAASALELVDGQGPVSAAGGVLVTGNWTDAARRAASLRSQGRRAAVAPSGLEGTALAQYAKRWGFDEVVPAQGRAGAAGKAHDSKQEKTRTSNGSHNGKETVMTKQRKTKSPARKPTAPARSKGAR